MPPAASTPGHHIRKGAFALALLFAGVTWSAPALALPNLRVYTLAGTGPPGFGGDGGFAADARLRPSAITPLPGGGFLVVEAEANRIRRIDPSGHITTIAGNGKRGLSRDGVIATRAAIRPEGRALALAGAGVAFAEPAASRIRAVGADGRLRTIAGRGVAGYHGDGGPATAAQLDSPELLGSLADGALLLRSGTVVRRFVPGGSIATVAGSQPCTLAGNALAIPMYPYDVAVAPDGSALIADSFGCLRRLSPNGLVTTIAGSGAYGPGLNAPTSALLSAPLDTAMAPYRASQLADGSVAVADANGGVIFRVAQDGALSSMRWGLQPLDVAGLADGTLAVAAGNHPSGLLLLGSDSSPSWIPGVAADAVAAAPDGSLIVAQTQAGRVEKVGRDGATTLVAGGGASPGADGDPATAVALSSPVALTVAADGSIFIGEGPGGSGGRVRRVSPDGRIWTFAGSGEAGTGGDGGPATQAQLSVPTGLAFAPDGSLWIADVGWSKGGRVRRVAPDGTISTVAGADPVAAMAGAPASAVAVAGAATSAARDGGGFTLAYGSETNRELTVTGIDRAGAIATTTTTVLCRECVIRSLDLQDGVPWLLRDEGTVERVIGAQREVVLGPGRGTGSRFFGSPDGASASAVGAGEVLDFKTLPGGGVAWVTGDGRIRVALPDATRQLATAVVRETLASSWRYRLVYRVTKPARVKVEIIAGARTVATLAGRARPGLNSVRLPHVEPGEYLVAVTASSGRQAARDRQRLLIGGRLPVATARRLAQHQSRGDAAGHAHVSAFSTEKLLACRRMSAQRVDCAFDWWTEYARAARHRAGEDQGCFVAAMFLRRNGIVYRRDYRPPQTKCNAKWSQQMFEARPHWRGTAREAPPL